MNCESRADISAFLISLGEQFHLTTFVETGTQKGDRVEEVRHYFHRIFSIELDPDVASAAKERFAHCANVTILQGPSGALLPRLLIQAGITKALFWLDAHGNEYDLSAPDQIPQELAAIRHYAPQSIAVIDDVWRHSDGVWRHSDGFIVNNTYPLRVEGWQTTFFPDAHVMLLRPL